MINAIIREDLYQLITTASIEDALYVTGVMILDNKFNELESIWIRACCGNDLKDRLPSSWKWKNIIENIHKLVKSDAFDISDAFILTTKLCILYKEVLVFQNGENCIDGKNPSIHIKQLRNIIMDDFPEDAMLSNAGVKKYARLLPKNDQELIFAHRILSGLSRIWTEKMYHKSRDSLEYLSRRKIKIDLPDNSWPSPSRDGADQFIWLLWGAALCYFHQSDIIHKMFDLFIVHDKKRKNQLYGILWHVHYIAGNVEGSPWTIDENKWIQYVKENAQDIWKQIQNTQTELKAEEKALKKASGHASPVDDFDNIFGYIPRIGKHHIVPEDTEYKPARAYIYNNTNEADICSDNKIKIVGLKASRETLISQSSVRKIE